jgi:outer membrane protein assembly factor BamB
MMRHLLLYVTLAVVALQATANAQPATPVGPLNAKAAVVRKFAADSLWRRVWVVGSDSLSDTFVEPRQVSVTGDVVVVLDLGTREVHGLDARSGATRFVLKPRGDGPGEFKRPARIASTPNGFVVLDHANSRVTAYDRTARLLWDAVLDNIFSIDGLCVRSGPRIVAKLQRRDSAIVEYDTTGRRTAVRSFPWKFVPPDGVAFAYAAFTSDASHNGQCVVTPIFGSEWGLATPPGPLRTFALKEPGPQAVVKVSERTLDRSLTKVTVQSFQTSSTEQASRGAIIRGDTAIIYAAHTKQSPLKLLDYYDTRTGEYLFSRKLPFIFVSLTVGNDGTFYGAMITANQQAVIALRPELPKAR